MNTDEAAQFDVLIVGAGPAGLAAAIRLKQHEQETGHPISVCVLEKGQPVGAHALSGALLEPNALNPLFPDWQTRAPFPITPVTQSEFLFLSQRRAYTLPNILVPKVQNHMGNLALSLSQLCRWLAQEAEALGVEIYAGISAAHLLYTEQGAVCGVQTGDMGVLRDGSPGPHFEPGMALHAKYTLFAEGCRGHLGEQLKARFDLCKESAPQTYALGLKEVWRIPQKYARPGLAQHFTGWPLNDDTYGGGFIYHLQDNMVALGLIVGLDYTNPWLSPFEEFQRLKTHPHLRPILEEGTCLEFGARSLTAGGLQALPTLIFPGGMLLGDEAGFLNAARQKGCHTAIQSSVLAAQTVVQALEAGRSLDCLEAYPLAIERSPLQKELYHARNFKPALKQGRFVGSLLWGIDQHIFRGRAPWTGRIQKADHLQLQTQENAQKIDYPPADHRVSFDRPTALAFAHTHHEYEQPCHLVLKNPEAAIRINFQRFASPEIRYCPAGVYEIDTTHSPPTLMIHAQNCLHCKTCDIKDPTQNIRWQPPQGGEGPQYTIL